MKLLFPSQTLTPSPFLGRITQADSKNYLTIVGLEILWGEQIRSYNYITALFFHLIFGSVYELQDLEGNVFHVDRRSFLVWLQKQQAFKAGNVDFLNSSSNDRTILLYFEKLSKERLPFKELYENKKEIAAARSKISELENICGYRVLSTTRNTDLSLNVVSIRWFESKTPVTTAQLEWSQSTCCFEIACQLEKIADLEKTVIKLEKEKNDWLENKKN